MGFSCQASLSADWWIEVRNRPGQNWSPNLPIPNTDWHRMDRYAAAMRHFDICLITKFEDWKPMKPVVVEKAVLLLKELFKQSNDKSALIDWRLCNPEMTIPGEALGL